MICEKALDKLRDKDLFHGCLKFRIYPKCGDDLEERPWGDSTNAYGDHLYCNKCDKHFPWK